jgi:hypothetical protein
MTGFAGGAAVVMAGEAEMGGRSFFFSTGAGGASAVLMCSGAGVSSTVECLPVVHGAMSRNSSKVRTRGLQHFQPGKLAVSQRAEIRKKLKYHSARVQWSTINPVEVCSWEKIWNSLNTKVLTFLPLVEHWRTWMIHAVFLGIGEGLSTPLVHALSCHNV